MKRVLTTLLIFIALCVISNSAYAERLIASLSSHKVQITSSFTGAELVLFGTIEQDATSAIRHGGYDIIVTVTGPRQNLVVRRKGQFFGVWVNIESRSFVDVPSYLAVLSTRAVDLITSADTLRRLQIGLKRTILPQQIGPDVADVVRDDPFRVAFLQLGADRSRYLEISDAVTFLTPTLFRASITLPAEASVGNYEVDVKLFANGAMIARTNSAFEIVKVGFEQFIASAAHENAMFYGLATAMMALLTGWLASVVFRRD